MVQLDPNRELEAALGQFSQQSGVSPDQEAQLRAAITSDRQLLRQLNQAAQAGQLQRFALPEAGSTTPNLVGHYNLQTGVVTLPTTVFQSSGSAASADLKAVLQVQEITLRFGHDRYAIPPLPGATAPATQPVSQEMLDNLQAMLNGSPVLAEQIKKAANTRDTSPGASGMLLENFGFVAPGRSAGGSYAGNTHTMNLPAPALQTKTAANPQGSFNADDLTFVIGHEIQHGFNHPAKNQASITFVRQAGQIARSAAAVHDYTAPIRAYIQAGRDDEAKAEIAGWNALLSMKQQGDPNFSLDDMRQLTSASSRTADFVEHDINNTTVPRPGLSFNPDNTLSQTPANIAAMGQHYFDRPSPKYAQPGQRPVHLGAHKDLAGNPQPTADYTNSYGTWALEQIVAAEDRANVRYQGARPRIAIDMAGIGLKEDLIEMEGLDLGKNTAPRPYLDTSQTPHAQGHFHHTQDGSVNPQHDHQHVPVGSAAPGMAPGFGNPAGADASEQRADGHRTGHPSEPSTVHPSPLVALPVFSADQREREERERAEREQREREERESRRRESSDPLAVKGPFDDPCLNRTYAALMSGDSDELDRIGLEFSRSPEGQRMAQRGDELLAEQQRLEQQQLQEQQAQARRGPSMSR